MLFLSGAPGMVTLTGIRSAGRQLDGPNAADAETLTVESMCGGDDPIILDIAAAWMEVPQKCAIPARRLAGGAYVA
jgi:hypothetical protein